MSGIAVYQDGSVDEDVFEDARKQVDECLVDLSKTIELKKGKEHVERFRRHWPLREGRFVHSMESCNLLGYIMWRYNLPLPHHRRSKHLAILLPAKMSLL